MDYRSETAKRKPTGSLGNIDFGSLLAIVISFFDMLYAHPEFPANYTITFGIAVDTITAINLDLTRY